MITWNAAQPARYALHLPSGKLGEIVGITLERSFTEAEVLAAAGYLIGQHWVGEAGTQAAILVAAQQHGHGSQSPQLEVMRYRPTAIEAVLNRVKALSRQLEESAPTEQAAILVQMQAASAEVDSHLAGMRAESERLTKLLG